MSVQSGFYTVEVYSPKSKPQDETHRLSVVGFKTPKDKKDDKTYKRPDARCVSIPVLKVHVTPSVVESAIQAAFEELQDKLIRDIVVEKLEAGEQIINLHESKIGFDAIAAWAIENAATGKLTKEQIFDWFDESLADLLTLKLADAKGYVGDLTSAQEKQLADAVTNYRNAFAAFAAPKAGLSKKIAEQLQKVLQLLDDDAKQHRVARSLAEKLALVLATEDIQLSAL